MGSAHASAITETRDKTDITRNDNCAGESRVSFDSDSHFRIGTATTNRIYEAIRNVSPPRDKRQGNEYLAAQRGWWSLPRLLRGDAEQVFFASDKDAVRGWNR